MKKEIYNEIVEMTQDLVRIPSRANRDTEDGVIKYISAKLEEFGLSPKIVGSNAQPSIMCHLEKDPEEKTIWLQAPLDTIQLSQEHSWTHDPFGGEVKSGKIYGVGVANCKVAIAMYSILARELFKSSKFKGNIILAFNSDEQCGTLTGANEIIRLAPKADICLLGYQGNEEISIGSRGWMRILVQTYGKARHTGSRRQKVGNAIHSMARIVNAVSSLRLKHKKNTFFWFGTAINFSVIEGGQALNVIPDHCSADVDIRLLPGQSKGGITKQVERELAKIRKRDKNFDYQLDVVQYQNAFLTNPTHPFINTLQSNIHEKTGGRLPLVASGHGSAGNLISELGIPVISAFGVECGNSHLPDEWVSVKSIESTFDILSKSFNDFCN